MAMSISLYVAFVCCLKMDAVAATKGVIDVSSSQRTSLPMKLMLVVGAY